MHPPSARHRERAFSPQTPPPKLIEKNSSNIPLVESWNLLMFERLFAMGLTTNTTLLTHNDHRM